MAVLAHGVRLPPLRLNQHFGSTPPSLAHSRDIPAILTISSCTQAIISAFCWLLTLHFLRPSFVSAVGADHVPIFTHQTPQSYRFTLRPSHQTIEITGRRACPILSY